MKTLYLVVAAALAVAATSCKKDDSPQSSASELKVTGELLQFTVAAGSDSPALQFAEADAIGILPLAAKVEPAVSSKAALKFTARSSGGKVEFSCSDHKFLTDDSIQKHQFAAVSPFVASDNEQAVPVSINAEQTVSVPKSILLANVPCYAMYEIMNPTSGSTLAFKFNPVSALIGIPVPETCAGVTSMTIETTSKTAYLSGNGTVNVTTGVFSAGTTKSTSVKLNVQGNPASPEGARRYYVSVLPGNHSDCKIKVNLATASGSREIELEGQNFVAGKCYNLVDVTPEVKEYYAIDVNSVKFDQSFIYDAKDKSGNTIAIICKEYLDSVSNQQAVTVYNVIAGQTGRVMDKDNPVALVARVLKQGAAHDFINYTDVDSAAKVHGGKFSFQNGAIAYIAAGDTSAINTVYAYYDKATNSSVIMRSFSGETVAATLEPRIFKFSEVQDTTSYRLVKMGRQIWTADNINTIKYNDGSDIATVEKAADFFKINQPGCKNTASSSRRIVYNVAAVKATNFLPAGTSWKVPTAGDITTLVSRIPVSGMITQFEGANNITCFSVSLMGRITDKKWDNTLDPCYWTSTASKEEGKTETHTQVLVVKSSATTAPVLNSGQNNKFGLYVRLLRGLF